MKSINTSTLRHFTRHIFIFWLCLISLVLVTQSTQAALLIRYNFDEASGNALDSGTGTAANATFVGSAVRTNNTPDGTGSALDVNSSNSGVNNYVNATSPAKLNASMSSLTLTTWINLRGSVAALDRIMANVTTSSGFDLSFNAAAASSVAVLNFRKNTTGGGFPSSTSFDAANKWVFVACVYDSASSSVKYYTGATNSPVAQLGTTVTYTGGGTIAASTADFRVGSAAASGSDRTPPAWFDDVRVYDTALTSAQLEVIRTNNLPVVSGVAPTITQQPTPTNQTIYTSGNATFTAAVTGDVPLFTQWYRNGTNSGNIITGATNVSLTLTNVALSDNGSTYSLFASNSFGTVWSSNATLNVVGVQITTQPTPTSQTLYDQSTALFSAIANGASPLVYQWYYFGTNNAFTNAVAGGTNATLALNNISSNSVGNYALFVTNAFGVAWSSNVTLAAVLPLYNTAQATNIWILPLGSRSYLSTNVTLNLERGLAFNPATTNLLLVARADTTLGLSGFSIVALDPLTGADKYLMNTNGISGGTFAINMIRVANDGAVFAANLTATANTIPYQLYRWANDGSTTIPTLSFSGDPGFGVAAGLRWGDNLALRGAGNDTQILLAPATGTNVAFLTTTNGGTNFTSNIIAVSGVPSGFAQYGLTFGSSTNTFWAKTGGTNLFLVTFDLNTLTGSVTYSYSNTPSLFRGIATDSGNRWLAGVATESPDTMRLYDVSVLTNFPVLADQELLGTAQGQTGVVTVPADSTFWTNKYVFALDPFNGISAFLINKATPTVTVNVGAYTYIGSAQGPNSVTTPSTGSVTYSYVGTGVTTYTVNSTPPTNAGTYNVTATVGADSYYDSASSSATAFTIIAKTASMTADAKSKTYGDANPALTATAAGTVNGDVLNYTLATDAAQFSSVGVSNITVTLGSNPNYSVLATNSTLTIGARAASVTADAKIKTYGDVDPALTATEAGTMNGDLLSYTLATDAAQFSSVGVSNITVTLGSNPNYSVLATNSTLTIGARVASVTADAKSKTYGDANPVLTATEAGTVNGDLLSYSLATDAAQFSSVGVSNLTVTLGSNPNYSVLATNSTLTIGARVASVTADAKTKTYGDANPVLTAMEAGAVNGDLLSYTLATDAAQFSSVGVSNITVTLGSNPNYSVLATNNTLTIGAKAASVTANNASKNYGQTVTFAGTEFTSSGLVGGNTITSVMLISSGATNTASIGTYPIVVSTATGSGLGNYAFSYTNGTLTVNAATPLLINSPMILNDGNIQLTFTGGDAGVSYQIQASTDLSSPTWSILATNVANNLGLPGFTDTDATNNPVRFYRTVVP